jgi:type II secretory ATPase GspE/PulE/Tfp pilus assembly ATPase PilB-like protein
VKNVPSLPNESPHSLASHSRSLNQARQLAQCSTARARELLDFRDSCRLMVLPIRLQHEGDIPTLLVAGDQLGNEALRELRFISSAEIEVVQFPAEVVESAILQAYKGSLETLKSLEPLLRDDYDRTKAREVAGNVVELSDSLATQFTAALLDYAVGVGASDIQLIPLLNTSRIQIRINGQLAQSSSPISPELHRQVVNRVKILARLDISKRAVPLDGSFSQQFGKLWIHFRLSTVPSIHGEIVALRILGNQQALKFDELGLPFDVRGFIESFMSRNEGALILSGPTGSGKTQTLYSVAQKLSEKSLNVISVEDPVECRIEGVSQISINNMVGLTFPNALKAVLRQDPDAIMLGEIRDGESAKIAIQAAQTGHLLLSSIHAGTCFEVLMRLRDLGLDFLSISQSLKLIIAQRLLPALCAACKVLDQKNSIGKPYEVFQPVGCELCNYSGFASRQLLTEALFIDSEVRSYLRKGFITQAQLGPILKRSNFYERAQDYSRLIQLGRVALKRPTLQP